jgi:glycosyltransferase involved in cell wall biosynthesis
MTPEIVVNGRFLSRPVTGVERYGREILSCIGDNYRLELTRRNSFAGHFWEQFSLPRRVSRNSVLWSPANTGPLTVERQALTIHDLSPLESSKWFRRSFAAWYALFLPILVKRVQIIFTPSEYVKHKIIKRFGSQNVLVTPNGVDMSFFHPDARQNQYKLPASYILFVGTLEPRKNLKALLQAWDLLQADFKDTWLVIAGANGRVHRSVSLPSAIDRVLYLGYVAENALPGLFANATLFVLPSLDEGFGLTVLEAMACGVPVLVSNGGALPETVGGAGFVYDLLDPAALAASIRQCLKNDELRSVLKEKGLARARMFNWRKTAELIWNTLNEI